MITQTYPLILLVFWWMAGVRLVFDQSTVSCGAQPVAKPNHDMPIYPFIPLTPLIPATGN
ncbi:hypothetical protein D0T11_17005 [Hymenobacter rubripertinctus]|uniref:Uncharacterized protein n=1 Tax=Hymenobacter rubripertinctus TaxID=2029981 RepID=A0A418QQC2_9BACT|nr:hypothetical protein D0T11_17005 [Hymenobacter rubripertinctus]